MPRYRLREDYGDVTPTTFEQRQRIYHEILMEKQRQETEAQAQEEQKQATQRMQQKVYVMEEQRQRLGYYEKTAGPEFQESVKFYTELGYPKLAGKYAPFEWPSGYAIQEIKETPSGLEVAFVPTFYREEPKGIAETLAGIQVKPVINIPRLFGVPRTPQEALTPPSMRKETVRPLAGIAGVIAPFESTVYLVRLLGVETPRPPPTLISLAPSKAVEYGPEYAAGTVMGDILLSIGFEKVAGKIWQYTPKIIKAPITKVAETVAKPFRPITEPIMSKLEKIVLWPHEKIAPGIVSIPTPERVGLKGMEAQLAAWELTEVPKTSGYLISKMPAEPLAKAWAMEHLFKTATGGLSYALVREQLRATAPPTMPYLPKTELSGFTVKGLAQALGVGIAVLPKALAQEVVKPKLEIMPKLEPSIKLKQPTFEEPYPIQKLKLFPQAYPRQREKQIPMLMPKLSFKPLSRAALRLEEPQISRQEEKLASMTALKLEAPQMTKQVQMLKMAMPTPLLQKQILRLPAYPRIPSMREPSFKRFGKGLFGKWFKREHAIPTERQIMRSLGFGMGKRRRGAKKRRR